MNEAERKLRIISLRDVNGKELHGEARYAAFRMFAADIGGAIGKQNRGSHRREGLVCEWRVD
jgi:hypothetical protein